MLFQPTHIHSLIIKCYQAPLSLSLFFLFVLFSGRRGGSWLLPWPCKTLHMQVTWQGLIVSREITPIFIYVGFCGCCFWIISGKMPEHGLTPVCAFSCSWTETALWILRGEGLERGKGVIYRSSTIIIAAWCIVSPALTVTKGLNVGAPCLHPTRSRFSATVAALHLDSTSVPTHRCCFSE